MPHTNKPPNGKEKVAWSNEELSYLGAGSAEWVNWARAMVALRSRGKKDIFGASVFELCLPKRGSRVGWLEADGETRVLPAVYTELSSPGWLSPASKRLSRSELDVNLIFRREATFFPEFSWLPHRTPDEEAWLMITPARQKNRHFLALSVLLSAPLAPGRGQIADKTPAIFG